jgi:hypothetical protein
MIDISELPEPQAAEAATGARNHDTDCAIQLLIPGG